MEALDLVINFIRECFNQPVTEFTVTLRICYLKQPAKMITVLSSNLCLIIMEMILIVLFLKHTLNCLQLALT